ncbi:ADP-ribosylation factor GTPase-activating protein [Achlya hypogyna]|uniref:ADP-ribosylation factor GTPase-activating protein n=1 Tax=Achlya hypogyna TaxID=1202772 RepID=A0A1V9Z495_ACHHY|nr:ADP-ribosylation factor GTPase-activating protein [Achlya hypogyna]
MPIDADVPRPRPPPTENQTDVADALQEELEYKMSFDGSPADDEGSYLPLEETQALLEVILALDENLQCADCNAPHPKWATVTHGGFICTQCAGVHRSLGVHLSFVLSCTLDRWTRTQLEAVSSGGNARLNETLEFSVPPTTAKPSPDWPRDPREAYIVAKYVDKAFRMGPNKRRQEAMSAPACPVARNAAASSHGSHGMVEYVGILTIELVEGAGLAAMDVGGSSDPYVSFRLGEQAISSHCVKRSLNPKWHETLRLSWDGVSPLVVQVYDFNKLQPDRKMGSFTVERDRLRCLDAIKPSNVWYTASMAKDWPCNFGDHMVAAGEGLTKGVVTGITGMWMDPIRGARSSGIGGFAKGVGLGMAGVVYRPLHGFGVMVKETALGVLGKKTRDKVLKNKTIEAGSIHLKLTLQKL